MRVAAFFLLRYDRSMRSITISEATASVAASHRDGCRCTVCRASSGDQPAMASVLAAVMIGGDVFGAYRQDEPCE